MYKLLTQVQLNVLASFLMQFGKIYRRAKTTVWSSSFYNGYIGISYVQFIFYCKIKFFKLYKVQFIMEISRESLMLPFIVAIAVC